MKRQFLSVLTILFLGLGLTVALAQEGQEGQNPQNPPASQQTTKTPAAKPRRHAHAMRTGAFGGAETLSGTITNVDADKGLVIVTDSNGIPFDFKVGRSTKITAGGKRTTLADLASATNKQVSVDFQPARNGNMAKSIQVSE